MWIINVLPFCPVHEERTLYLAVSMLWWQSESGERHHQVLQKDLSKKDTNRKKINAIKAKTPNNKTLTENKTTCVLPLQSSLEFQGGICEDGPHS